MSEVTRGDSSLFDIPIMDGSGQPYPLYGCTVWVTVKTGADIADDEALYQHWITVDADGAVTGSQGMTIGPDGASAGVVVQELTPVESVAFDAGSYTYDVQVMTAEGRIYTPINGDSETVLTDLTRAITRPEVTP